MLTALLLAASALLQAPPVVEVVADRPRVGVGEVVTVTITASSTDSRPMTITVNPPDGLSVIDRRETTDPLADADGRVTATLTLRLRALEPGRWPIGPVRAFVGGEVTDVDGVVVEVGDPPELSVLVANPRLRALLERAPMPRRPGDVVIRLLTSADSVRVGGQVDVVAAAWFPRALRLQLRRPPVLQPPVVQGVWSREQGTGGGLVTSRRVGDEWYDLFVAHQVIFPLAPGELTIPRAMLQFGAPSGIGGESRLFDGPRTLRVRPLPAGAPSAFSGAVGSGLLVTRRVDGEARLGQGLTVEYTVAGRGNAALWPTPELNWPAGVRAYPDGTSEVVDLQEGRLGGSKTFRYAVVPARAGTLTLPAVRYAYFDPSTESYRDASLPGGAVTVRPADPTLAATPRLPLLTGERVSPIRPFIRAIPGWGWAILVLLPMGLPWLRARHRSVPMASPRLPGDVQLRQVLAPLAQHGDESLAAALFARGATEADVRDVERVRRALAEAAYGPRAGGVPPSLAEEAARLASRLAPLMQPARHVAQRLRTGAVLLLLTAGTGAAMMAAAQADAAEAAFARGDFQVAAQRFLARTARAPHDAAPWYNLGAASLAAGDAVAASAAFMRAARRAPRLPELRAAAAQIPTTDRAARAARQVPPVALDELLLAGIVAWWLGWLLLRASRTAASRHWALSLLLGGALGLGAAAWLRQRELAPMALVRTSGPLRRSPHERGEVLGELVVGSAVQLRNDAPGWRLIRGSAGEGWVTADRLVLLSE